MTAENWAVRTGTARARLKSIGLDLAGMVLSMVESVGASFSLWAGSEEAALSAKCLGGDVEAVLTLVRDCLEAPAFPLDEIERVRGETLNNLREMDDNTRTQADLRAHALLAHVAVQRFVANEDRLHLP